MVLIESLLEPKARHSEGLVVVIAVGGLLRKGRLGDAPGQTQGLAVLDLTGHGGASGFGQDRPGQTPQQQPGHDVLEHGPAPGDHAESRRLRE